MAITVEKLHGSVKFVHDDGQGGTKSRKLANIGHSASDDDVVSIVKAYCGLFEGSLKTDAITRTELHKIKGYTL